MHCVLCTIMQLYFASNHLTMVVIRDTLQNEVVQAFASEMWLIDVLSSALYTSRCCNICQAICTVQCFMVVVHCVMPMTRPVIDVVQYAKQWVWK